MSDKDYEVKPHKSPESGKAIYIFLCNEDVQRLHIPMWSHDMEDANRLRALRNFAGARKLERVVTTLYMEEVIEPSGLVQGFDHVRIQYAPSYIDLWKK